MNSSTANEQLGLAQALPKIWIGYLLCMATFIAAAIVVANHPEIIEGQPYIPLPLFLLGFVSFVYWLVCVHQLHMVLAHVPGWKHPISPARAVWFHFIPFYNIYWLYKWPSEVARFVQSALGGQGIKPRNAGIFVLLSYALSILLGGGLFLAFFALSLLTNWVRRALVAPMRLPPTDENASS